MTDDVFSQFFPEMMTDDEYYGLIDKWNKEEYVIHIRELMDEFKPLFSDIITWHNDVDYDCVIVKSSPDYICQNVYAEGCYSREWGDLIEISGKAYRRHLKSTLLHEMIHMYELNMTIREECDCEYYLNEYLRTKIPDLDNLIKTFHDYKNTIAEGDGIQEHDDLFFLESLNIDKKMHFQLGITAGYGVFRALKDWDYAMLWNYCHPLK